MRSRTVSLILRLLLSVVALLAFGGAAFVVKTAEQRVARTRAAERVFNAVTRDVANSLSDLRISQAAYVAAGQDVAFWVPRVAGAIGSVTASVTLLRSTATTDTARASLDAAAMKVAEFSGIDQRARDYIDAGMPLMAGDMILSDGGEAASAVIEQLEMARNAEQTAAEAADTRERRVEAQSIAGAAAVALVVIIVLLPRRQRPAESATGEPDASITTPVSSSSGLLSRDMPENLARLSAWRAAAMLPATAKLCTDLGRVSDLEELKVLLGTAAELMDARGLMVWVGSADGAQLQPGLAHGYTQEMLASIPTLRRSDNNAAAAAFRTGQLQIVLAHEESSSGAIVAPILSSRGCLGVVSAETQRGTETSESLQALAAILAAQLAGVLQTATPEVHEQRATGTI
jgi:hypothetical protein